MAHIITGQLYKYFLLVTCANLAAPANGMISCSLGIDGVPTDGDTCNFTCSTGYELIASGTRTCGSDGTWDGTNAMCRRGNS